MGTYLQQYGVEEVRRNRKLKMIVITAGTAPFGDQPGEDRMQPARFVRGMLCLNGRKPAPCPSPAHFDALAHHPYSTGVYVKVAVG